MFRRILSCAALLLMLAAAASATLSETTYNKYFQSASIPAYTMFSPVSTYNGNYQFTVVLNGNADACTDGVTVTISYTDEQGVETWQTTLSNGGGSGTCTQNLYAAPNVIGIHNLGGTPVFVTVTLGAGGAVNPVYNLSVDAIGFW